MVSGAGEAGDNFLPGPDIADPDIGIVFQARRVGHVQFLGALELLVRLGRREGLFDGVVGGAQIVHQLQGSRPEGLVFDQDKHIHRRVKFRQQPARAQQLDQDDIAHAEAECGQVHLAAADELDEVIVASAAGDRP